MKNVIGVGLFFSLFGVVMMNAHAAPSKPSETVSLWDAKAYYNRGTASYEKEDFASAIKDLSKAITLEPKAPDAYFNRGLSLRRLHRNAEAISDFSAAIRLYAFNPSYYLSRCNARIVQGDYSDAVEDASHAIQLIPGEARGYFMRGLAFMLNGDLDEALVDSVQALQLDPFYPDAQRLLQEIVVKKQILPLRPAPTAPPNTYMAGAPKDI